ncbi:GDSL-type esterase/lipase family protein [Desulfolutivibrio sulfoxidireducens]|uniref:GDSL-type esterase/lipase family protein n=1 Tax=Desulfolutivibrio sulfoxidireducens TaxID=2773299 RepID=UPI00159EB8E0|nr:GDSL-type esterase/lipase family protein [Desulfolutivibrio sulfoxidireducens]QLA17737.1 lysophospholipase [Desulfolutivibrio sulfoxidireducens]
MSRECCVRAGVTAVIFFLALISPAGATVVFLGSSQTAGWKYVGGFKDVVNKGAVSNNTSKILASIQPVLDLHPDKVFILEGINEIHSDIKVILDRYEKIIRRINAGSPDTMIFVQSLLPVVNRKDLSNDKIVEFNKGLEALCGRSQNCVYVDLHSHFLSGGTLNKELTSDGVHLKPGGYRLWQSLIEHYVTEPNDRIVKSDTLARLTPEETPHPN